MLRTKLWLQSINHANTHIMIPQSEFPHVFGYTYMWHHHNSYTAYTAFQLSQHDVRTTVITISLAQRNIDVKYTTFELH
jgi:hypothetical protein